jgi:hypothetical protein
MPSGAPDDRTRAEAAQQIPDCRDTRVAGPLPIQDILRHPSALSPLNSLGRSISAPAAMSSRTDSIAPKAAASRLVEHVLSDVSGWQTVQPSDIGGIWSMQVGLRDQSAVRIEEPFEPVNASSTGGDPRCVRNKLNRRENIDRCPRGVIDRGLKRRDAMDSTSIPGRRRRATSQPAPNGQSTPRH